MLDEAHSLKALGDAAIEQFKVSVAQDYYTKALSIYAQWGDPLGQVRTLQALGDIAYFKGDRDTARKKYQRSLELGTQINDFAASLNGLTGLIRIEKADGNYPAANRYWQEWKALVAAKPTVLQRARIERLRREFADLNTETESQN